MQLRAGPAGLHFAPYAAPPPSPAVTITEIGGHDAEMTSKAPCGAVGHDDRNDRSRSPKYALMELIGTRFERFVLEGERHA
jgi:hypothetical protein